MRIAYASTFDARDVHQWSGTPYHMSQALEKNGIALDYTGPLKRKLPRGFKLIRKLKKYMGAQQESHRYNIFAAKQYSLQLEKKLKSLSADIVLSPLVNPIAFLDCKQAIVLWTDAVYAGLLGFYPSYAKHSTRTIQQANQIMSSCLSRCRYAIFSSDWAANGAIELYGTDREKVKVIPYGANISSYPSFEDLKTILQQRSKGQIKLLFLAKEWERKGGDTVLAVTKALHDAGYPVKLTIAGVMPELACMPSYVKCTGFISKQSLEGKAAISQLLYDSHFLFLPSRADACPMVYAEANAYGLPCLSTYVGGISTAIKDNLNGMTFAMDTPIEKYADYIARIMNEPQQYHSLALSSYNEYITRLNWQTASRELKTLLEKGF